VAANGMGNGGNSPARQKHKPRSQFTPIAPHRAFPLPTSHFPRAARPRGREVRGPTSLAVAAVAAVPAANARSFSAPAGAGSWVSHGLCGATIAQMHTGFGVLADAPPTSSQLPVLGAVAAL
jgi:hypothetical protein